MRNCAVRPAGNSTRAKRATAWRGLSSSIASARSATAPMRTSNTAHILVIPVLVDGARLPDPASLPEELRPLCRHHVCELTDPRWSYDVGELVKDIEKIVARPEPNIFTW